MAFTFFFRDRHTLEQLTRYLIPAVEGFTKIKVWDAGCAMGPEPYTFGIIFAIGIGKNEYKRVQILASDIDESSNFKEIVQDGIYPKSDLSRMPDDVFENWFAPTPKENYFQIDSLIRDSVNFIQHDLLTLTPPDTNFNAIICKNVLLHFQASERIEVFKMFHNVLVEGGLLTTEQTQPMPDECKHLFERVVTDANIYRKIS